MCITAKGFTDKPMFAAQNCMYIQAVGGDRLGIEREIFRGITPVGCRTYPAILVK